jgi:hypothetical protein
MFSYLAFTVFLPRGPSTFGACRPCITPDRALVWLSRLYFLMQNMKIFWNLFSLFLHPRVRGLAFCSIEIFFTREICWSQVCQVPPCACACLRVCVHWVRVCVFVCLCVFSKRRGCLRTRTNLRQTRRASPQGFLATPKWSQEKPREFYPRIRREQGAWNCGGCQCAVRWVLWFKNQRAGDFVSEGSTRQVAGIAEVRQFMWW